MCRWASSAGPSTRRSSQQTWDGVVPHGLRHTAASLAISAGANVEVIQKMLGHDTATSTLDLYGICSMTIWTRSAMNQGAVAAADRGRQDGRSGRHR
ncbi:tyrosine-type recombinase/integrase [Nocardia sp. NPDC050710]|uniref:tyrosine-type recombinase/integrase n=1 Tax=Nocardia sp. NPDC050710 TaxID=3157220 RepID=UPI0033C5D531